MRLIADSEYHVEPGTPGRLRKVAMVLQPIEGIIDIGPFSVKI